MTRGKQTVADQEHLISIVAPFLTPAPLCDKIILIIIMHKSVIPIVFLICSIKTNFFTILKEVL